MRVHLCGISVETVSVTVRDSTGPRQTTGNVEDFLVKDFTEEGSTHQQVLLPTLFHTHGPVQKYPTLLLLQTSPVPLPS